MSAFPTIDALRAQLGKAATPAQSEAYAAKMLHKIPAAPVVDRAGFLRDACRGKRVLEFGASGPMSEQIRSVAASFVGFDREDGPPGSHVYAFDLDDVSIETLPPWARHLPPGSPGPYRPEVIVCGEVLEHLSNPGWFLTRLHEAYAGITTVITVPNAFCDAGRQHIQTGVENVNPDHVAWYSYKTLSTLLGRAGYTHNTFAWYGGRPYTAEGLIVVLE